jgi:hypothetical protein
MAYETALYDEHVDSIINKLVGLFEQQSGEGVYKDLYYHNNGMFVFKIGVIKFLQESSDNLSQLNNEYGDITVDNVLRFMIDERGNLSYSAPEYGDINMEHINDLIIEKI